jgi:mannosyltransferase
VSGAVAGAGGRTRHTGGLKFEFLVLGGLIVLAAALRFGSLGLQSFWFDEAVTGRVVGVPRLDDMIERVARGESTPPLFYLLTWLTAKVGGQGDVTLRFVSALSGTVLVPVAWASAKKLADARAGLLVAAMVAVSPLLLNFSQEARAYELLTLLCATSFLLTLHALDRPTSTVLAGWAVASIAALCTHYFAAFVLVPEAALLLWRSPARRGVAIASAAVAAAGAALLPLFLEQRSHGTTNWISDADLGVRVRDTAHQFAKGVVAAPGKGLGAVAIVLVAGGLISVVLAPRERRNAALLALGVGVVAVVLPLLLALAGGDVFFFRNLQGAWVPMAVGIAIGLSSSRAGLVAGATLCLVWLAIWVGVLRDENYLRDDWQSAAQALTAPRQDRALVVTPGYAMPPLARYGHFGFEPTKPFSTRELVLIGVFDSRAAPQKGSGGLVLTSRRQIQKIGIARYHSARPTVLRQAQFAPPGSPASTPRLYLEPGRAGGK